eukprot:4728603-Prorocentrum_lima.AAC.1
MDVAVHSARARCRQATKFAQRALGNEVCKRGHVHRTGRDDTSFLSIGRGPFAATRLVWFETGA